MKKKQKITRVQLVLSGEEETILLGIVSADRDYKISLAINNRIGISLRHSMPLEVHEEGETNILFSRFSDLTGAPDNLYSLISNRAGKNFLLKKLRNIDFLFHFHPDSPERERTDRLIASLRSIEGITAVFEIDRKSIRDKNLKYIMF
jgi:hypothetical protein